jgi:adenylate cyclase
MSQTYRFDRFVLDLDRGLLLADGAERALRAKTFALLRLFVENSGRVVSRDEILEAIWPDAAVTEDNVTQCVKELRCALDDDTQSLIRTLPRRGYLFAADVKTAATPAMSESGAMGFTDPPLPERPSIAVLPFQNMSGDPNQEYFADGTVEEITTALSRIRWLFVIARNSAFTYRGPAMDVKQVSRELGVRYVLEGSVRKGGNHVRVTAQLIDAINGTHIWADRYDRELNDIFAVQDEIAGAVASVLEPTLAAAEQQRALRKPPDRLDVWETWQRGMWHFHKPGAGENRAAQTCFRRALEMDPAFAPGHYSLALALLWDEWLYSVRLPQDGDPRSVEHARVAVALDDRDAMAHAILAQTSLWFIGDRKGAIAAARAAFALNPSNTYVLGVLGLAIGFDGDHEEAIGHLRQAMRVSPHDPMMWSWKFWMGRMWFSARQFEAALESHHEALRLRPDHALPYIDIVGALAFLGRRDEARAMLDQLRARTSVDIPRLRQPSHYARPEDWALQMEGLRLAGLEDA